MDMNAFEGAALTAAAGLPAGRPLAARCLAKAKVG